MDRSRRVAAGLAVLALVLGSTPVAASGVGQQRSYGQEAQSLRVQIDLAKASDTAIETEANRLAAAVQTHQASLLSVEQAASAAQRALDEANASFAENQHRAVIAKQQLVTRAVNSYVNGGGVRTLSLLLGPDALQDEVHREEYLTTERIVLDNAILAMRSAQRNESSARKQLQQAQRAAANRATTEAQQVAMLAMAEKSNALAHAALQGRISALLSESPDLAALDSQVQALVLEQDAAATEALASLSPAGPTRADGNTVSRSRVPDAGLIWPLHGPVTTEFGPRWGGFHPGIDIAPPYGTPIAAAKDGLVVFAGYNGGYGNFVVIDHGGGLATAYAHQSRIATALGDVVRQGQIIGYEGSTGDSTGPHLHFEVRVNGAVQNPRAYESGAP